MDKSFIAMLTAINEPQAIERAYQIFAAKRELLARQAEETEVSHPQQVGYKLYPSYEETIRYMRKNGKFVLRMHGIPVPVSTEGFRNGQLFELQQAGAERSSVVLISNPTGVPTWRKAIIHNKHLESVFWFKCGCIGDCCCSARN